VNVLSVLPTAAPVGAPVGAPLGAEATPREVAAKADRAAADEFASVLNAALQPSPPTPLPTSVKKVAIEDLVDANCCGVAAREGVSEGEATSALPFDHVLTDEPMPVLFPAEGARHERVANPQLIPDASATDRAAATAAGSSESDDATAAESATTGSARVGARMGARMGARRAARVNAAAAKALASTMTMDAAFAGKLATVIAGMREAGHEVEVLETVRSDARQRALYAQGRTTPGNVVTWTLDSQHMRGQAADLKVDGAWSGPGYDVLQRLAKEAGLHTLGAKDPGHVELPRTTADARDGAAARHGLTVMRGSGVAQVARVAEVAQVARVATPGAFVRSRASDTSGTPVPSSALSASAAWAARTTPKDGSTVAMAQLTARPSAARGDATVPADEQASLPFIAGTSAADAAAPADGLRVASRESSREMTRDTARDGGEATRDADRESAEAARTLRSPSSLVVDRELMTTLGDHTRPIGRNVFGGSSTTPVSASHAAERAAELIAARDAAPAPTVGELRLSFDPSRDGLDEVRLAVSGRDLDATLRTSDAGVAYGLQNEIASLTRSLERQGFDSARVAVALDQSQQQRAAALDTVAQSEATAADRALRGDSDAAREGREQQTARREQQHDQHRDQQRARVLGSRFPRSF